MTPDRPRRSITWIWVTTLAVTVAIARGPRAEVESSQQDQRGALNAGASMPASLAEWPAWLERTERQAGVTDTGVMKRVRFADAIPSRTAWSIVYLHGFSATRQETAPLAERLADSLHTNLFETRLQGHGLPAESLSNASARQWIRDAEGALAAGAALGDSVLLIGTSTGGTLAAWLASQPASLRRGLHSVILIAPNFGVKDPRSKMLTWPWAPVLVPRIIPTHTWPARNAEQARYWTTSYSSRALFPMVALVKAMNERSLDTWTTPTLVFASDEDAVVETRDTREWLERLRATSTARIEDVTVVPTPGEDNHVLAGRITAPSQVDTFVNRILRFVRG